jgi:hypothetical protein
MPLSPTRYTEYYMHVDQLLSINMELRKSILISRHYIYSHNYQSNVYHIEYNLVQQNASANSKMDEYSENKVAYINIQEIN